MTISSPRRNPEIGEYCRVYYDLVRVFAAPSAVIAAIGDRGFVEIQSTFHFLEKGDEVMVVGLSEAKVLARSIPPTGFWSRQEGLSGVVYVLAGNRVMGMDRFDFWSYFEPMVLAEMKVDK